MRRALSIAALVAALLLAACGDSAHRAERPPSPPSAPDDAALAAAYPPGGPRPGPSGSVASSRGFALPRLRVVLPTAMSVGASTRRLEIEAAASGPLRRVMATLSLRGRRLARTSLRIRKAGPSDFALPLPRRLRGGRVRLTVTATVRRGRRPRAAAVTLRITRFAS